MQKVQNTSLHCVLQCNTCTSVKQMHNDLKILTLEQQRNLNHAVQCYKESTEPSSGLHYMFTNAETSRPTRRANSKNIKVPRINTEIGC